MTARIFRLDAAAAFDRALHGLRIGVHGEEGRAQLGDALDTTRDGVADVVHLEIGEHLLALVGELADQRQAAGISELIADLVEGDAVAEPRDHRLRGINAGKIERNDQAVLRGDFGWRHVTSHHALGNVDQLPHQLLQRVDIGLVLEPVHIVIGLVGKGERELAGNHIGVAGGQDQPQRLQRTGAHRAGSARRRRARRRGCETRRRASRADPARG